MPRKTTKAAPAVAPPRPRRRFGNVEQLPSGRYRASYKVDGVEYKPPTTFEGWDAADSWLNTEEDMVNDGTWVPPQQRTFQAVGSHTLLRDYGKEWIDKRRNKKGQPLAPRTAKEYRAMFRDHIEPQIGGLPLRSLTVPVVAHWHDHLLPENARRRSAVTALLSSILTTARKRTLLTINPCESLESTARPDRVHKVVVATIEEMDLIEQALGERYRAMFLLAAWCDLRFGELVELRRKDVNMKDGTLDVFRAAGVVDGKVVIGKPKGGTERSERTITIPPHIRVRLSEHLLQFSQPGPEGLLFPPALSDDKHLAHGHWNDVWMKARAVAGRPDLRFHDLRHTASSIVAAVGGSAADVMFRNGQSTIDMAMHYTHELQGADERIANAMSDLYRAVKEGTPPPNLRKTGLV